MKNYFIERCDDNKITSLFARPQRHEQESLKEDNREVIEYLAYLQKEQDIGDIKSELQEIDNNSIRSIREFIITKFEECPLVVRLKDYEKAAIEKRKDLI